MGFVMKKGPGTEEILSMLHQEFFLGADDLVGYADLFKPTAAGLAPSLTAAAKELEIYPTDRRHKRQWRKWLAWMDRTGQDAERKKLTDAILGGLTATPVEPIVLSWEEHNNPLAVDPVSVTDGSGKKSRYIVVRTKHVDKL